MIMTAVPLALKHRPSRMQVQGGHDIDRGVAHVVERRSGRPNVVRDAGIYQSRTHREDPYEQHHQRDGALVAVADGGSHVVWERLALAIVPVQGAQTTQT